MHRIVSVVGSRPNIIKLSILSGALEGKFDHRVIDTGQHYDPKLASELVDPSKIPKQVVNLGVGSGSHGEQTGTMLIRTERKLKELRPELVIVYGDTNSTLAGALATSKMNIPLAHVEAGLRSYDRTMPEEVNRVITDHLSQILFCPTPTSVENLEKEGITSQVHLVGDIMYDSLKENMTKIKEERAVLDRLGLLPEHYILVTLHRPSNVDKRKRLRDIVKALTQLDCKVVFPVHPRTRTALIRFGLLQTLESSGNVLVEEAMSYVDFLSLLCHSEKVLTDSGGVQKEAYLLGIPCVTLRETTEWVETVELGWNKLVKAEAAEIVKILRSFKPDSKINREIFGDGNAREKIVKTLRTFLNRNGG